jgi:protein O-GlcNAc transferase
MSSEFRLLLACARANPTRDDEAMIRAILIDGVDWTRFARIAVGHGLASLAGHAFIRITSDLVPDDILEAFREIVGHTRERNQALLDALLGVLDALAKPGIEAVPFNGPILAIDAYGDLGLRRLSGHLDLFVRAPDLAPGISCIRRLGYERERSSTAGQSAPTNGLDGQENTFGHADGSSITLCTRLTPMITSLDIDDGGLWRRAQPKILNGRTVLIPASEDALLLLAVRGGNENWRNLRRACDFAGVISSHPGLEWSVVLERAQAQGCRSMFLLASSLARNVFGSAAPDAIVAAERADPAIEPAIGRIVASWRSGKPIEWRGDRTPPTSPSEPWLRRRADAERAVSTNPNDGRAWSRLGDALSGLNDHKQAIACYDKALALAPDIRILWRKRNAAMAATGKSVDLELELVPQDATAWTMRAGALSFERRYAEAIVASERALRIDPGHLTAAWIGIHARNNSCDWRRREDDKRRITESAQAGLQLIPPFYHRMLCGSEAESRDVALIWATRDEPVAKPCWRGERYRHDKIRIAYICAEFREHAVAILVAGVFEHHDRRRFETTAISLGPGDGSDTRRRLEAAFDRFIDAQDKSDAEVATLLRALEIDILIDLNGYAGAWRTGILARRPAPVQVSYVGYTGTMGVPFIDYIIADRVVIPAEHRIYYSEKVVYLPHTYLPGDNKRVIAERVPSRTEENLPEAGFVFVCFNDPYKTGPETFDVWMRLLGTVEGSVLWLRCTNIAMMSNTRREANARGIGSERLVFALRQAPARHLARHRLADLFLDTLPYNAHTTASDALWAGLPVVTCLGNSFSGRVAASLLHAIGLPELVTASLAEYEALALKLAQDPDRLAAIRTKLISNRDTEPPFDTAGITSDLETAYMTMWERAQRGEPPESFSVADARRPVYRLDRDEFSMDQTT